MSEGKTEDSIEFDLDDILEEETSDDNLPVIEVEEIEVEEIEVEQPLAEQPALEDSEESVEGDGNTFQDQVREYMGSLQDEEPPQESKPR